MEKSGELGFQKPTSALQVQALHRNDLKVVIEQIALYHKSFFPRLDVVVNPISKYLCT